MENKFFVSKDYDLILENVLRDNENPFGLFRDMYLQNKERNPDFLVLALKGIERKQYNYVKIWNDVLLANPEMKLDEAKQMTPDYYFFERLKSFVNQLKSPDSNKQEKEILPPSKPLKSILDNQEQIALMFYYLQKVGIIPNDANNYQIAKSIQFITGYSFDRLYKKFKTQNEPSFKISRNSYDFEKLINKLKRLIDEIEKDKNQHKKEGEIK